MDGHEQITPTQAIITCNVWHKGKMTRNGHKEPNN